MTPIIIATPVPRQDILEWRKDLWYLWKYNQYTDFWHFIRLNPQPEPPTQ